jgi:hypothetical protein
MESITEPIYLYQACKFILCVLLTQYGKTFQAINRITTEIEQDEEYGRSIHIVFTMNTLLNNKQFAKRLEIIENTYGKGSICVFASTYNGKYTHVRNRFELQGRCADELTCPRVVVMCSNTQRYDDGVEFLKVIDKNRIHIHRAFAYYDELHKYISSDDLRSQIELIHDLDIVSSIIALTATPEKIWRKDGFWSKLRLIQLDNFNDSNYAGCNDMIFNCVDDFFANPYIRPKPFDFDELDKQTLGFIYHVLKRYPDILQENTRTFIPAHIRRSGHNSVRELVFSINPNAIVIVINGFEKTLQYKDNVGNTKTIPLTSEDEEVCETISRLIDKHKLHSRPIVITGFLCVGMGQTLTHKLLGSFTSAIFGHLDLTNDEISQLFGRITGRIKDWGNKYVQTQVYCPTTIMHRCRVMEECARNMACNHNGDDVTLEDYREPMNDMGDAGKSTIENIRKVKEKTEKREKKPEEFTSGIEFFKHSDGFEASDKYIQDTLKGISVPKEKLHTSYYFGNGARKDNKTGFYKSSLVGDKSKVKTLEELLSTKQKIVKNAEVSFGRTNKDAQKTGFAIKCYYGYEDTNDINSLWYGIRWIRKLTIPDSKVAHEEHKEDVWSNPTVLTNQVVEHPIAAQAASSDSTTHIKNKPKKGPKIAPK